MDGSSEFRTDTTLDGRHAAAIDAARRQFERAGLRAATSSSSGRAGATAMPADWPVDALPGYEIGPEIHRGGQGVVYRAVQRGTQRDVAIKIMREGRLGGPREKARFEREIQILGQLKHPNIVTIHESGTSVHGVYFVMDYIDGQTLDAYVAGAKLGVRETLSLFAGICRAIHVAHLRGVIHRDLKPANIRVDPAGQPHVLDFGLAKFDEIGETTAGSSIVDTMTGQFIGSLPWASPEQIEGRSGDIDVRTDVYALGMVLFQVLTGRMPYEIGVGMRQIVDSICHAEPPAPSSIRAEIDGDVDAIVLKCLRKEKDQRYQSAGDVAADIERFLVGEPIDARRDSALYVISRQIRRHRVAASFAGLFILVVAAALITSLTFWRRAVHERTEAEGARAAAVAAEEDARKQGEVARAVTRFLTQDVLLKLDPYNTQGEAVTARALFDRAAADVDAGEFKNQPLVEAEIRTVLGMVYLWMSDFARAEAQLRATLEISRREAGPNDARTLLTMGRLGTALARQGKLAEAEPLLREALEIQSRAAGEDDLSTVMARSALAAWCVDADRPAEAASLYRDVLEARTRLQGPDHADTLAVMSKLAGALTSDGKLTDAEPMLRDVIERKRRVHGDRHPETLIDLMHLANVLHLTGRNAEAQPLAEEALAGLSDRMGAGQESTQSALVVLATIQQSLGNRAEAEALFRRAVESHKTSGSNGYQIVEILLQRAVNLSQMGKLLEAESVLREALKAQQSAGNHERDRLRILSNLVNVLGEQGRSNEAVPFAEECVTVSRRVFGDENETTNLFINNHAFAMMGSGDAAAAETRFREAIASQRRLNAGENALTLNLMHNLALSLGRQNKHDEEESLLRAVLASRRKRLGDQDVLSLKSMHALASVLRERDRLDEAELHCREAVALAEKKWPDGHYLTEHFRCGLGTCLIAMKRYDEAEKALLLCQRRGEELLPAGHPNRTEAIEKLIVLYDAWGKPDEAAAWRGRLPNDAQLGSKAKSAEP